MHTSFSQTRRPGGYPSPWRTRPISPFLLALVSAAIGRRVSRWGDRSIRDRPAALVGHQPVNEPRAFSSTTRPTGCLGLRTPKQTSPSSGAQARLPGLLPADHSSSSYVRGGFGLIATIGQDMLRMRRDPDVGQKRFQVHLVRREGSQQSSHIRARSCIA